MNHSLPIGFVYDTELWRGGQLVSAKRAYNLVPQSGVDHFAALLRGNGPLISSWYVGLFEGNFVPDDDTTSSDLPSNAVEFTGYSESARPAWTHVYDGTSVIDNNGTRATFTVTSEKTVYGGFLVSNSSKGGNSGVLLSIARFSSPDELRVDDEYKITAGITLVPTAIL